MKDRTCEDCGDHRPHSLCCGKARCLSCLAKHGQSGRCQSQADWWEHRIKYEHEEMVRSIDRGVSEMARISPARTQARAGAYV